MDYRSNGGDELSPPVFAPLPVPFIKHVCARLSLSLPGLEKHMQMFRSHVYSYMDPIVRVEAPIPSHKQDHRREFSNIDTGWLLSSLAYSSPNKQRIPLPTFSDWHKRHLLRYRAWGYPDVQNAAALLLMRILCRQNRGWLPSEMSEQEPQWWCWRQDAPDQPVLPCPYPLPSDLPATSLLWTVWSGAAWDGEWVQLGNMGAMRWGAITNKAAKQWGMSLEQLAVWDMPVTSLYRPIPSQGYGMKFMEEQFLHVLATTALYRLAHGRLL